jgi:hypothetical protein
MYSLPPPITIIRMTVDDRRVRAVRRAAPRPLLLSADATTTPDNPGGPFA